MIISIDPSTKKTGVALFTDAGKYIGNSAAVILPDQTKALAIERVHQMAAELRTYISEAVVAHKVRVRIAVIEKPYIDTDTPRSAVGAQFYAIGAFYHVLRSLNVTSVIEVAPASWTRGKSKEHRAMWIRREYGIAPHQDSGNDAVDAIGLGKWWCEHNPDRLRTKDTNAIEALQTLA